MFKLFGYKIGKEEDVPSIQSFAPPFNEDGAFAVNEGGVYGTAVELGDNSKNEMLLITKYREMAAQPECERAIDDIINEAIVYDKLSSSVSLVLDGAEDLSASVKGRILDEFDEILSLLNFSRKGYNIFRNWYVDGRLYYHKMIDTKNIKAGIQELRYIDPRKIKKIRVEKTDGPAINYVADVSPKKYYEYFVYSPKGILEGQQGLKIAKDSITYVTSGVQDETNNMVLSHLHKAIKPLNQLRTLEDATVIYRLARAPERRVFYIDVGNLPKAKAEQYLRDTMAKHKNKLVYDAVTGDVKTDRKFLCYALDTKIPLLDGRTLEISEIIKEYEEGKTNWVYSCDIETGKFIPGPVSWAGVTKKESEVVRVTFDNGKSVVCTPDHKFPVWNKGFVEAQHLSVGESLIPGYRRNVDGCEQIYKNDTQTWEFTHREVVKWKKENGLSKDLIVDDSDSNFSEEDKNQKHDHKVVSVEFLDEKIPVAALTIDQEETYHSHHTYLLDAGVYTKNTMLEDYFLPRREGSRGTEITTLAPGQNLGEITDVEYFRNKLYESLNVPVTRLQSDGQFNLGRSSEITRDELKFANFISRLRVNFSALFVDLLKTQLLLKGVLTRAEWDELESQLFFDFKENNQFSELKDLEILRERLSVLGEIDSYTNKYFSKDWVRKNILKQTEEEIEEIDAEIEASKDEDDDFDDDDGEDVEETPKPKPKPFEDKKKELINTKNSEKEEESDE